MNQTLIVYYSWSGHTAALADALHALSGAATCALQVAPDTFPADMYATADVAKKQLQSGQLPALIGQLPDCTQYATLLIGGPVWSGTLATPVLEFLQTVPTGAARLVPFYTHAGTPGAYEAAFKQAAGARLTAPGFGSQGRVTTESLQQWFTQL